jgi:putative ABC transport system permease protein
VPPSAVRTLLKNPGFTLPALLILSLGIGATVAIFAVVDGILLEPLDFPDSDRLVTLCEVNPSTQGYCVGSVPNTRDLGENARTLEAAGSARWWSYPLRDDRGSLAVATAIATPEYLRVLGVKPLLGRVFTADEVGEEGNDVLILTHAFWQSRYGGDPDIVGRTVQVDDEAVAIIGVLPADFGVPGLEGTDVWRPVHVSPDDEEARVWRGFQTVARLAPGASLREARTELTALYRSMGLSHEVITDDWRLVVRSLLDEVVGDTRGALLSFLGAVALLLTIACANVANLLLVRSARRRQEFAVRAALGARQEHLVGTVLAESLALALLAGAVGVVLAWWGSGLFVALAPAGVPRLDNVGIDPGVLLFAVLVSAGTVVLFGLLPALRVRDSDLAAQLTSSRGSRGSPAGTRLRRGLVVAEMALSLMLLFGSGLLARSFAGYLRWDPGFDREGLMVASVIASTTRFPDGASVRAFWGQVEEELATIPGVQGVSTASAVPLRGGEESSKFIYEGGEAIPEEDLPVARFYDVGPGHFANMGVPMRQGREIGPEDDPGGAPVAMVNETFARLAWPGEEPLGKWIEPVFAEGSGRMEVVGVVADVQPLTPGEAPRAEMYWSNRHFGRWGSMVLVRARPGATDVAARVRARLLELDPDMALGGVQNMDDLLRRPLAVPRFNFLLIGVFAAVALVLAIVGVYGVLAYTVAQQARSIGIRIAMGQTGRSVLRSVLREGGGLALMGIGVGIVGVFLFGPLVAGLAHGVSPRDPLTLAATASLLLACSLIACYVPARRASRVDPASLLREE